MKTQGETPAPGATITAVGYVTAVHRADSLEGSLYLHSGGETFLLRFSPDEGPANALDAGQIPRGPGFRVLVKGRVFETSPLRTLVAARVDARPKVERDSRH